MRTIYRSRNSQADIPRATQVIFYEDWAVAAGFGFVLTFSALMIAAIKMGEFVGIPQDTWHATFKSGFTYFDMALSCLVAWSFGGRVKPHKLKQTRGAVLYEDTEIGGDGFQAVKALLDDEFRGQPGKAPPLALLAPKGVDIHQVRPGPPYQRRALTQWLFGSVKADPFSLCAVLSDNRSRTHILIFGGTGSGKSLTIKSNLHQAKEAGHKLIILDRKGEYTEEIAEKDFHLFGKHDKRQFQWDVAKDIKNIPDIKQFIAVVIPRNDSDPIWSDAARIIATGLFAHLLKTEPGKWSLIGFLKLCLRPTEELIDIAIAAYPQAAEVLKGEERTLSSFMVNMAVFTTPIKDFALEWEGSGYPKLSYSEWLEDPNPAKKCLIFQSGGGKYSEQNDPMIRASLNYISGYVDSPSFKRDSVEEPRSIWFFCDEFQSFGKLDVMAKNIIERGRDKGLRMVIGVQDVSQLREVYGEDFVKALMSSVGITILAGANQGETAEIFSKNLGQLSFMKTHTTQSESGKSTNDQEHTEEVLTTSEIIGKLGFKDGRTRSLYRFTRSPDVYIVHQPLIAYPRITEPTVPADWVLGIPRAQNIELVAPAAKPMAVAAGGGAAPSVNAQELKKLLDEEAPEDEHELPPGYAYVLDQTDDDDEPYSLDLEELAVPVASIAGSSGIEHALTLIDLVDEAFSKPKAKAITRKQININESINQKAQDLSKAKDLTIARNSLISLVNIQR